MPPLCFCYYISPSLSNEFWLAASIRSENAFPSSVQQSSLPSREHLPSSRSVRAKFSATPFQKGSFCNFLATVNAKAMFLLLQALRSRISFGFLPSFIQKMPFHRQFSSQACRHANICRHCAASLPAWRKVLEGAERCWQACHHSCQHLPASPSSSFHYSFLRTSSFPRRPSNAINLSSNES